MSTLESPCLVQTQRIHRLHLVIDDDWSLLQRATHGDEAAWTALSIKYRPRLLGLAFTITRSRMAAEDVAQESFARLLIKPPRPSGDSLMPYLSTIAFRMAVRESKRQAGLVDLSEVEFHDPHCDPEAEMINHERANAVAQAIGILSEEHRTLLALRFQGELSYEEIAGLLRLPLGTVKSRLFNAVMNCRKRLCQEGLIDTPR